MSLNKNPDETLLFSELALAAIPRKKFKVDSWSSLDLFMDYAAELFGWTVNMLIQHGYLQLVEEQKTPIRLLGIRYSTKIDYLIHRQAKSTKGITIGLLEEKILNQFKSPQTNRLSQLAFLVFSDILQDKDSYINPGKVFILQILKHQKLNRFLVEEKSTLLSKQIIVTSNTPALDDGKERSIYVNPANKQFVKIIEIIGSQLRRFQDLD